VFFVVSLLVSGVERVCVVWAERVDGNSGNAVTSNDVTGTSQKYLPVRVTAVLIHRRSPLFICGRDAHFMPGSHRFCLLRIY
jgi:hypothetical protein